MGECIPGPSERNDCNGTCEASSREPEYRRVVLASLESGAVDGCDAEMKLLEGRCRERAGKRGELGCVVMGMGRRRGGGVTTVTRHKGHLCILDAARHLSDCGTSCESGMKT